MTIAEMKAAYRALWEGQTLSEQRLIEIAIQEIDTLYDVLISFDNALSIMNTNIGTLNTNMNTLSQNTSTSFQNMSTTLQQSLQDVSRQFTEVNKNCNNGLQTLSKSLDKQVNRLQGMITKGRR